MPITRKQFELGIDEDIEEWMKKIHEFLSEKNDQAFNISEVLEQFEVREASEKHKVELALDKLVEMRSIGERMIKYTTYYSYTEGLAI